VLCGGWYQEAQVGNSIELDKSMYTSKCVVPKHNYWIIS